MGIDNSLMDELNSKVVESIDVSPEEMVESGKSDEYLDNMEGTIPQPPRIEESEVASMEHIITDIQCPENSDISPLLQPQNTPPYEK